MRTYVVWCPDLGQEQEDGATIPATDPDDAAELAKKLTKKLGWKPYPMISGSYKNEWYFVQLEK